MRWSTQNQRGAQQAEAPKDTASRAVNKRSTTRRVRAPRPNRPGQCATDDQGTEEEDIVTAEARKETPFARGWSAGRGGGDRARTRRQRAMEPRDRHERQGGGGKSDDRCRRGRRRIEGCSRSPEEEAGPQPAHDADADPGRAAREDDAVDEVTVATSREAKHDGGEARRINRTPEGAQSRHICHAADGARAPRRGPSSASE